MTTRTSSPATPPRRRPLVRAAGLMSLVLGLLLALGVTKYIGMGSGPMMMPGEKPGGFQRAVHVGLRVAKLVGVDMLEQNEWERDSLLMGKNGADGITWVLTRPVRPTKTPYVGASVHKDKRGPMNCSIYDHGDFCLSCVTSSEWDKLAPHVSSGPQPKKKSSLPGTRSAAARDSARTLAGAAGNPIRARSGG